LNHYDCAQASYATQKRVYLLDDREVKTERVSGPKIAVQPDSLDARLLDAACQPRTEDEMRQTAARAAAAALAASENRPHAMHAEMISAAGTEPPHSMKVADTHAAAAAPEAALPAAKPRMFPMPMIDKSKAEDPYKGMAPPAANEPAPAPAPMASHAPVSANAAPKAVKPIVIPQEVQDLSRHQREMMLATSGMRKVSPRKKVEHQEEASPPPDYAHAHWGYAGLGAPENWAKIRKDYATCGTGERQSPIDIRGGIKVDLEPIKFDYHPSQFRVTDNGHTVQVDVGEGNTITVTGHTYQLVQFHFHRPAEERINGKAYDMVAHFVHKDFDNNIAVVALLLEKGMDNPYIQTVWNYMPLEVGMSVEPPDVVLDLAKMLPENRDYYTYMGSLTTPPCTENVLWMVLKNPVDVSLQQIGIFARLYPHNARPVQPNNSRLIKESR